MKSFLVHLASLAVMVHMTFGCHWHHGLGSAHACTNQKSLSACCESSKTESENKVDEDHGDHDHGDHDHDGHDHDESDDAPLTSTFDDDGSSHGHNHLCCQDDGCSLIKVAKFKFTSLDFLTQYLGGAEDSAVLQAASTGFVIDPFPDCLASAPKVRAHLLLGVQLI